MSCEIEEKKVDWNSRYRNNCIKLKKTYSNSNKLIKCNIDLTDLQISCSSGEGKDGDLEIIKKLVLDLENRKPGCQSR